MTLEEFADVICLRISVWREANNGLDRTKDWGCCFEGARMRDKYTGFSDDTSTCGSGTTPIEAIGNYVVSIRGKFLVVKDNKIVHVPENLTTTSY